MSTTKWDLSLSRFNDHLDHESSWRKQEISILKRQVNAADTSKPAGRYALRSAIAMLYAHWEGWVKSISQAFLKLVNKEGLSIDRLSFPLAGRALQGKFRDLDDTRKSSKRESFARFIFSDDNQVIKLDETVYTGSNLKYELFKDILIEFGIDNRAFETKGNMIDSQLLAQRNRIAHGESTLPDKDEVIKLVDGIIEVMERFETELQNATILRNFERF